MPLLIRVKVKSFAEAACKDATSKGTMSRHLNFIPTINEILTLRSTRNSIFHNYKGAKQKNDRNVI